MFLYCLFISLKVRLILFFYLLVFLYQLQLLAILWNEKLCEHAIPKSEKISTNRRSHIGTHQWSPNHVGLLSLAGQILQSARNFRPCKRWSHLCGPFHFRGIHDFTWQSHSVLSYNQNKPEIVSNKKSTFHSKSAFNNGGVGGVRTLVQTMIYQAFYMLSF